jgi:hypothetical protein
MSQAEILLIDDGIVRQWDFSTLPARLPFLAAGQPHISLPQQPNVSAMAPIRRYLRITKYSVLECRIYLDNPALAESWLLNSRSPVLPRVIESVRPLVLPKLREENERSKSKGGKKKGVKDVVIEGMTPSIRWPWF